MNNTFSFVPTSGKRPILRPRIIGLAGPAGCGKDTVAQLLVTHMGFSQLAFADPLREEICQAFGVDLSMLTEREAKESPIEALSLRCCSDNVFAVVMLKLLEELEPASTALDKLATPRSPRQIMRWWGTEYRRNACSTTYWTRILKMRAHLQQQRHQLRHVVSDVRFHNEAQAIRDMGGVIWQIKRPGLHLDESHSSETDGSAFAPEVVINNNYDLRHLQYLVMAAWDRIDEMGRFAQSVEVTPC